MQIQVYVIALILILESGTKVDAESFPRPSNVSIICDSYKVEVHWEYPHNIEDVVFQVEVKGNNGMKSYITSDHWINISNMLINPLHNHYVVYVTAKQGDKMSEKSQSDIFSFNEYIMSTIKCQLDYPNVNMSAKEGKLHLQFTNPLHLYRNTPALRNNTNTFSYTAETDQNVMNQDCEMENKTCETLISFPEERKEYCLNLTGKIGQRVLKDKRLCFSGDLKYYPPASTYLYPLLGVVLTLLFITAVIMLLAKSCNEKIKKKVATDFPNLLDFKPAPHQLKPLEVEREKVESNLQIVPISCDEEHGKLIEICDGEKSYTDEHVSSVCSECYSTNKDDDELEVTDASFSNVDSGNYRDSLSAGYDCPHVLTLEMSPGDLVEGYRA